MNLLTARRRRAVLAGGSVFFFFKPRKAVSCFASGLFLNRGKWFLALLAVYFLNRAAIYG